MSDKNTFFHQKSTLNARGTIVDLSSPKVMGIVNITPDSFYDGGKTYTIGKALGQVGRMLEEGAAFIDIGAYSSRPNAEHITAETELERLIPVVQGIVREFPDAILSIDTFRAEVARAAINQGAHIVNDISAGEMDKEMFRTMTDLKVPYILMHMKGTPQTMLNETNYTDLFEEVFDYFVRKTSELQEAGVVDIIIDPGFGFAKTADQSFELLNKLDQFKLLEFPVLAGLSRKSMICKTLETTPDHALNGTTAANTIALLNGAKILRVHDVKAAVEAVKIVERTTAAK
ncbi:dihydropteroate synthase [Flavihumibacter sp. R14]|nr:dihydropteroate synthase [Flavihumibacter soli]